MKGFSQTQLEELSRLGCEAFPPTPDFVEQIIARRSRYAHPPASDRQKARLRFLGYKGDTQYMLKWTASGILDRLVKRQNTADWETWKQDRTAPGLEGCSLLLGDNAAFSGCCIPRRETGPPQKGDACAAGAARPPCAARIFRYGG